MDEAAGQGAAALPSGRPRADSDEARTSAARSIKPPLSLARWQCGNTALLRCCMMLLALHLKKHWPSIESSSNMLGLGSCLHNDDFGVVVGARQKQESVRECFEDKDAAIPAMRDEVPQMPCTAACAVIRMVHR